MCELDKYTSVQQFWIALLDNDISSLMAARNVYWPKEGLFAPMRRRAGPTHAETIKGQRELARSTSDEEVLVRSAQRHCAHIARKPDRVICHVRPGRVNIQKTLLNGATVKY